MSDFPSIYHQTLRATLIPIEQDSHYQFRGIKYASIPRRFEHSILFDEWNDAIIDCRGFGPKCPQPYRDIRQFYSLPVDQEMPPAIGEDELSCLNLVVSVPDTVLRRQDTKVPVYIYVHGGGHSYTMVNIEQGFTDPTDIIKTSLQLGKPVIIVHFAYRLNVFGYGMFQGRTNFGFHDQRRAIEWVQKHISGFGGDPENITLAGESAGGIAVHAHIHGPCPVRGIKRAVLQSGSLYLTPPAPAPVGHVIMKELELICQTTDLQTLPLKDLLTGMGKLGFKNWWLNQEDRIFSQGAEDAVWPITDTVGLESIVVGDCQWESRGFEAGIAALGLNRLEEIFSQYTPIGAAVAQLYSIDFQSMESTKPRIGAFINDLKFAFASDALSLMENKAGRRRCYRYIVDQPNPWNPSAGAHHAVDLLLLFGGYDYTNDEGAVQVSQDMRKRWIHFMYGDEPWGGNDVYAFGPAGKSGAIGKEELARRRRVQCFDGLRKIGWANCQALATRLMSARGKVEEAYL